MTLVSSPRSLEGGEMQSTEDDGRAQTDTGVDTFVGVARAETEGALAW